MRTHFWSSNHISMTMTFWFSLNTSQTLFCLKVSCWILDFQKVDPFWNIWSKPNPETTSEVLYPAQFFHNLERKICHENFVKTEKTEYLSNQLTYAYFDRKFIFPIKFGTSEQIFIFWISKMFQISGTTTVKQRFVWQSITFDIASWCFENKKNNF